MTDSGPYRDERDARIDRLLRKVTRLERALSRRQSARLRMATVVVSVLLLAGVDAAALSALSTVLLHGTAFTVNASLAALVVLVLGEVVFVTWLARRAA